MTPRDTTYRLATTEKDKAACRALMKEYQDPVPLGFPTVMALRDGELIGFLSTHVSRSMLVAGPLVIRGWGQRRAITMIRLIEAYDAVMQRAGIKAYHFHVERDNEGWRAQVERAGFEPWHEDDEGVWYRRELNAA